MNLKQGAAVDTKIKIHFRCEWLKGPFEVREFTTKETWSDVLEDLNVPRKNRNPREYAVQTIQNRIPAEINEQIEVLYRKMKNQARKEISIRLVAKNSINVSPKTNNNGSHTSKKKQTNVAGAGPSTTQIPPEIEETGSTLISLNKMLQNGSVESLGQAPAAYNRFDEIDDDVSQYGDEDQDELAKRERSIIIKRLHDPVLPDKYFHEGKRQYQTIPPIMRKKLNQGYPDLMTILHHAFQDEP